MTDTRIVKYAKSAIAIAIGLFALLWIAVFLTGQTFGQRCAEMGFFEEAHRDCVKRLSDGEQ